MIKESDFFFSESLLVFLKSIFKVFKEPPSHFTSEAIVATHNANNKIEKSIIVTFSQFSIVCLS